MTTPQGRGPRRRRRPSQREINARRRYFGRYISQDRATRMAENMSIRSPRSRAIMPIMKRRAEAFWESLKDESVWDDYENAYVHDTFGIVTWADAIEGNTEEVMMMLFTESENVEPELYALHSP